MRFRVVQAVGLISNLVIGIAGAESQQNIPFVHLLPFADVYGIYQFGDGCLDFRLFRYRAYHSAALYGDVYIDKGEGDEGGGNGCQYYPIDGL